jgi:hypothetical protein
MTAQIHTLPFKPRLVESATPASNANTRFDGTISALMVAPFNRLSVTRKELALIGTIVSLKPADYGPRINNALTSMDEALDEMQALIAELHLDPNQLKSEGTPQ